MHSVYGWRVLRGAGTMLLGLWAVGAAQAAAPDGLVEDVDLVPVADAALDLRAAGLFQLSDGSLVVHVRGAASLAAERIRLLLYETPPPAPADEAEAEGERASHLLDGGIWYRRSEGRTGWNWDAVCEAASVRNAEGVVWLLPWRPKGNVIGWRLETTDAAWQGTDRMPETGRLESDLAHLPTWPVAARELNARREDLVSRLPLAPSARGLGGAGLAWRAVEPTPSDAWAWTVKGLDEPLPIRAAIKDALTGESHPCTPTQVEEAGASVRWKGRTPHGVDWTWVGTREPDGAMRFEGLFSAPDDRCLQVGLMTPLPGKDWRWNDDVHFSREIEEGVTAYGAFSPSPFGLTREQSRFPLGVIHSDRAALCIEVDPLEPRVFQIVAEPDKNRWAIYWDLGLSPRTAHFPGQAFVAATFRSQSPGGPDAFRVALADFYARFPSMAEGLLTRAGLWMPFAPIRGIPQARDFGFAYREVAPGETPHHEEDVFGFVHAEPWMCWMPLPRDSAVDAQTLARLLRFYAETAGDATGAQAQAASLGALRDAGGAPRFQILRGADSVRVWTALNTDPELMTTPATPFNGALTAWDRLHRDLSRPGLSGVAVDGFDALRVLDYNPAALAVAHFPCSYSKEDRRPGAPAANAAVEWLVAASSILRADDRLVALHDGLMQGPFFAPYADAFVERVRLRFAADRGDAAQAQALMARRILAGRKPCILLQEESEAPASTADMEAYLRECLFFGFLPGMDGAASDAGFYWNRLAQVERDRPLFKTYGPWTRRLAEAGWMPRRRVACPDPGLWIEQFGSASNGVQFVTVRHGESVPVQTELRIEDAGEPLLAIDPFSAACEVIEPREGRAVASLRLAGGAPGLRVFVPLSRAADELAFLQSWSSGAGEAEACVNNLQSVLREREAKVSAAVAFADPALRGADNAIVLRVINQGAEPLAFSEPRLLTASGLRALSAETRMLAPGESVEVRGTFQEADLEGNPWIEVQWKAQRSDRSAIFTRRLRPTLVEPMVWMPTPERLTSAGLETEWVFTLQNNSRLKRDVGVSWKGDFQGGEAAVSLAPASTQSVRLPIRAYKAGTGRMEVSLYLDAQLWKQRALTVEFLPPGGSLLRDSSARIEADSTAPGHGVEALKDGVTLAGISDAPALTWHSDETGRAHWVRIELAQPLPIGHVQLYWPAADGGGYRAGRLGLVRGWTPDGRCLDLAEYGQEGAVESTALSFTPVLLKALEIRQPPQGGPKDRPDAMALSEVEVR